MGRGFIDKCSSFMAGPVAACAKRLDCTESVFHSSLWNESVLSLRSMLLDNKDNSGFDLKCLAAKVKMVLMSMSTACMSLGDAAGLIRKTALGGILRAKGHGSVLRFFLLNRLKGTPAKFLSSKDPVITDDACRSIFTGDEESRAMLPKLSAWLPLSSSSSSSSSSLSTSSLSTIGHVVAARLARYIVRDMPGKGTGYIGVPETMAASLPYLDRLSIICSIGREFLCRLASGYIPSETAWSLLDDGVRKEVYEWDSTFVDRLLGGSAVVGDGETVVELANWYMQELLYADILGQDTAGMLSDHALGKMMLSHRPECMHRFVCIMGGHFVNTDHDDSLAYWFHKHMEVYGGVYAGMCQ